ncbi:hypothetical protein OGATHE_001690 [Ogataea polymorpha]|uniref:Uncharacterized protein n=1 Tax=Ogataea polymorpha TaxID=460523 RepID=A0A9P8TE78_9ASCO|nr:hypothetical protein OGATHE_001690 [Ogataea polymorpha]
MVGSCTLKNLILWPPAEYDSIEKLSEIGGLAATAWAGVLGMANCNLCFWPPFIFLRLHCTTFSSCTSRHLPVSVFARSFDVPGGTGIRRTTLVAATFDGYADSKSTVSSNLPSGGINLIILCSSKSLRLTHWWNVQSPDLNSWYASFWFSWTRPSRHVGIPEMRQSIKMRPSTNERSTKPFAVVSRLKSSTRSIWTMFFLYLSACGRQGCDAAATSSGALMICGSLPADLRLMEPAFASRPLAVLFLNLPVSAVCEDKYGRKVDRSKLETCPDSMDSSSTS